MGQQPAHRARDVEARAVEELRGRLKGILADSAGNRPGLDASGLRWVDGQPGNALRVPVPRGDRSGLPVRLHPPRADRDRPGDAAGLGGRQPGELSAAARTGRSRVVAAAGAWMARPRGSPAPGDRHRAVDPADEHPARRPRGPAARALVRHRLQVPAQRSACASSSGSANSCRSRPPRRSLGRCARCAISSRCRTAMETPRSRRSSASSCRAPRSSLSARASYSLARSSRRGPPSGRRRRTRRCEASTRRASRSSSTSSAARCSSPPTRPGKLICARYDGGQLNTHFRDFPRPMGLAVAPATDRASAPGPRSWDYRNFPAVAAEARAARQARRLLPAAQQALHRRHPHPRDRVRAGRALARHHQLLLPGDARRRAQLRAALEAAVHHRARARGPLPPERPLRDRRPSRATSPPSARPTRPAAGARTRRAGAS